MNIDRERETIAELRRIGVAIDRGVEGGRVLFRTPERHRGRAEPMGFRDRGKLRDLNYILTSLRSKATYRYKVTSPRREAHMVLDVRHLADARAADRLIEAAGLVGGVLLTMPETTLTLGVFGAARPYPPARFVGESAWRPLHRTLEAARRLEVLPEAAGGALRRACGMVEGSHAVLLTCAIEPGWVATLRPPLGATLFAVEPPGARGSGGLDPLLLAQPLDAVGPRIESRYDELAEACASARIIWHPLPNGTPLIHSLRECLDRRR
jgi:hypothetical protein